MSRVVGRDAELATIRDLVASLDRGAAALALEGDVGMGKTTLWRAGVALAEEAGRRVLSARPSESETSLSYSGVGDLLDPVLERALDRLPPAQRRALSRALVLDDSAGPAPDVRAIGVALLNALRALAAEQPVLLAVDDVQWLDAESVAALAYAARRLGPERVGILLARRTRVEATLLAELRRSLADGRLVEVDVGPLDSASVHRVVSQHLGVVLPRPLLAEVHAASGGNPLYALEIVRMLKRTGVSVEAGQPLPLPESLQELVHGRLLALPRASRELLLCAAALSTATLSTVEAASGVDREQGLLPALDAGIVELEGDRVRFTHPLLAAGAYELADPLRRARVHARLAELVDDPEARGRHLAAAVAEPDEGVAAAIEEAARHARARGAPRAAALLLDRARELTPRRDEARRRAVDAAYLHYESGDSPRAEAQLQQVIAELAPGAERARALVRLGRVRSYEAQHEAVELLLQAIAEADGEPRILAVAHEGVASCLFRLRERLPEAVEHAQRSAELAEALGDHALASEALGTQLVTEALLGRETAAETATRALALQEAARESRVLGQPLCVVSVYRWWTDALDEARAAFLELLRRSYELGDESSVPYLLVLLGQVESALGLLGDALERAHEGQQVALQSGQPTLVAYHLALEGLVRAQLGDEQRARASAGRALELAPETGGRPAELLARWALGHLEVTLGAHEAAAAALEPSSRYARGQAVGEPGAMRSAVDHIEALVALGRLDEATELLGWYEGHARRLERVSALASCARCRGLLAAAAGRTEDAAGAYGEALAWHARVELPLDRARTLLALGAVQRRAKRRREARATLEDALALFERLGAALWVERARAELRRISGRAPTPHALTPAEERVAALVAEGKTNREVAAALYLSDRTVEGHLSRIFGKLGIRHRAQLARALQTRGIPAPNTGEAPVSAAPPAP